MSMQKNIPVRSCQNTPLAQLGLYVQDNSGNKRRYTKAQEIEQLAISMCKNNENGITFNDLLNSGLATSKEQAQITLKYYLKKQILFTLSNRKPQKYYPACLKSNILKNKFSKNIPIGVTEPRFSNIGNFSINNTCSQINDRKGSTICDHCIVLQPLENYVL